MTDRSQWRDPTQVRRRLEVLAWLMDSSIPLPGVQFRIGLDGLLGLLPGFGDAVGALVSSFVLGEAARLGAPRSVLLKMAFNVGLDAIVGLVPFLGDLFDFGWKANRRNIRLLEAYLERPQKTAAASRMFIIALCLLLVVFVIGVVLLGGLAIAWLWQQVSG